MQAMHRILEMLRTSSEFLGNVPNPGFAADFPGIWLRFQAFWCFAWDAAVWQTTGQRGEADPEVAVDWGDSAVLKPLGEPFWLPLGEPIWDL